MFDYDSYITRAFGTESNNNPNAKNPLSSATGLGQFTDGTWRGLSQLYPELGLTPDGRTDPAQSRRAMGQFTFDNAKVLQKQGIPESDNSLYAMHRFGAGDGPRLLRMDPNTPIASAVSADILAANPDLAKPGVTVGQALNRFGGGTPQGTPSTVPTDVSAQSRVSPDAVNSVMPTRPPGNFGTLMPAAKASATTKGGFMEGGPGAWIGLPDGKTSGGYDVGAALQGAGAGLASIGSPSQAAALAAVNKPHDGKYSMHYDPATGTVLRINNETGVLDRAQNGTPPTKLTETALKHVSDNMDKYSTIQGISQNANELRDLISSGKLDLGAYNNWINAGRNTLGVSNDQSRAYAKWEQFRQQMANDQLLQAKGVQTEGDAYRAMRQFAAGGAQFDNATAKQSLDVLLDRNKAAIGRGGDVANTYKGLYGDHAAFQPFNDRLTEYKRFYDDLETRRKASPDTAPALNPSARDTLKTKYGLK